MNGGDLTRSTFRAHRHYSGVRMQQGRVQLDADWNEQLDLTAHRDRAEAVDVIGAAGVPKNDAGFGFTAAPDGSDLLLSPGRAWVGGILCEVDAESTAVLAVPDPSTVEVASLVLDGLELATHDWVEVIADGSVVSRVTGVDAASRTVSLDAAVDALTGDLRLRRRLSYAQQPDLPGPEFTGHASATDPYQLDLPGGSYLAVLDAWQRSITSLDDPQLSEPALGVDTTTRSRVVWQVRLVEDTVGSLDRFAAPTGRMAARSNPPTGSADLCRPTPAGGYVGLENQLYRVHVHDVAAGRPVVLWSRENASVVTTWSGNASDDVLVVASIGRDAVLGFTPGDWVELYDDSSVLLGRPGTLVRLLDAKGGKLFLDASTASGPTRIEAYGGNPQVRRWDSPGPVIVTGDEWIDLENGVQIQFAVGGTFRVHDYWLVPARSAIADIDWPVDSEDRPLAQLPRGTEHSVARLAALTSDGVSITITDSRDLFPSLTELTATDVSVSNDVCLLPGVRTVQDAIDALCRSNDLRRHNRLLHGYGIVCGLAVHCGDTAQVDARRQQAVQLTTDERRGLFISENVTQLRREFPTFKDHPDLKGEKLDALREAFERRTVTVEPGAAINADGYDLDVSAPIVVDVLTEVEPLGVLDETGKADVCLVLRSDPERGPVVAVTKYENKPDQDWLENTLIKDIYDDCIAKLFNWIKAQLTPASGREVEDGQRAFQLRSALTNLLSYVANPESGVTVLVSKSEHDLLADFYLGLRKRLESHTFCAMFDDARAYPEYPDELARLRTISGQGMHSRVRMHPGGQEAWTVGGGFNPLRPSTTVNRYNLVDGTLIERTDPVSGNNVLRGAKASATAAAVTDVAFSPDGKRVYVALPTRDENDTLFIVGEIGDAKVNWLPSTTICGVKLVTLVTTEADPDNIYAVGVRKIPPKAKAVGAPTYTGAGIWQIPSHDIPDTIGPMASTAGLNTVGSLEITARGEAVFACADAGATTQEYSSLVSMVVPTGDVMAGMPLDAHGSDDFTLIASSRGRLRTTIAWVVTGSGDDRSLVGYDVRTGAQQGAVPLPDASGKLAVQAFSNRVLICDTNTSLVQVFAADSMQVLPDLKLPVQVSPVSLAVVPSQLRQAVVLNLISNSLTLLDAELIMGDKLDLSTLIAYRRSAVEAFMDLVGGFVQYLKDCICDHMLVNCPPPVDNLDLDLAVVSIRGGSVYNVCNFSRRRYVKSFPTVGYWMSLVPLLPWLGSKLAELCCTVLAERSGKYTAQTDASDRVGAATLLTWLDAVQSTDPLSALRSFRGGGAKTLFNGINTGDWDGGTPRAARAGEAAETSPSRAEIVFGNILKNPRVNQELRQPRVESDDVVALMERVSVLEAQLTRIEQVTPTTGRPRKATAKAAKAATATAKSTAKKATAKKAAKKAT